MMGPWVDVDTEFQVKPTGMTEGEEQEWDSMVENITNAAVLGMARNTDKRDLPTNTIAASSTKATTTTATTTTYQFGC